MPDINSYIDAVEKDPTPKKKAPAPTLDDFIGAVDKKETSDPLLGGNIRRENPEDYDFNLKAGIDNDLYRAEQQGFGEELGKSLGNLIPNIVTGIGEQVGYLHALATEWGDNRDYSNALTETMKSWKNPFGEVYQKPTKDTFALSDSAWWLNNGFGLIESVGEFAALGYGVGSLFGKGAALLGRAGVAGAYARGAAQVATAATLAYAEGAMSGHDVFKRAYDANYVRSLAEGLDPEAADAKAKHIAAQAASTTVQLNTMLGTALNISAVGSLFKNIDEIDSFFMKGAGKRAAGESAEAFETRIAALGAENPEIGALLGSTGKGALVREGLQEGGEEMMNMFTEKAGDRVGKAGKDEGFIEQFGQLQNFFSDTMNSEGALNFILGALGGVAQTVVLNNAPSQRQTEFDDQGNPIPLMENGELVKDSEGNNVLKTKLYSGNHVARNQRLEYFNNAKEAVLADLNFVKSKNTEIQEHLANGDQEAAKAAMNELMGAHNLKAVMTGTTDNWVQEYESYGKLDNSKDLGAEAEEKMGEVIAEQNKLLQDEGVESPDQLSPESLEQFSALDEQRAALAQQAQELAGKSDAMVKGFAEDMDDNGYKAKAVQAIADLKQYDKWHKELQKKFRSNPEYIEQQIPGMILGRRIDAHLRERHINALEQDIEVQKLGVDTAIQGITSENFNSTINEYNNRVVKSHNVARKIQDKIADLEILMKEHDAWVESGEVPNTEILKEALAEFRIDYDEDNLGKAIKSLYTKLIRRRDLRMKEATDTEANIAESLYFQDWQEKNPGKSLRDYLEWIAKQVPENDEITSKSIYLEQLRDQQEIANEELRTINNNPIKFARKVHNDINRVKKAMEETIQDENANQQRIQDEQEAAASVREKNRDYTLSKYKKQLAEYQAILQELQSRLPSVGSKMDRIKHRLSRDQKKLRGQIADTQAQILSIQDDIDRLSGIESFAPVESEEPVIVDVPEHLATALENFVNALPKGKVPSLNELNAQLNQFLLAENIEPSTLNLIQRKELVNKLITNRKKAVNETEDTELEKSTQAINDILGNIPTALNRQIVKNIVDGLVEKPETFDWDAFKMPIKMGTISATDATKLLANIAKIHDIPDAVDIELSDESGDPVLSAPPIPVPGDPNVVATYPFKGQLAPSEMSGNLKFVGRKTVNANKIQRMDLSYVEFASKDGKLHKRSNTSKINPNTNSNVLVAGGLKEGDEIRFEVDTDYNGTTNIDEVLATDENDVPLQRPSKFADYIDGDGKIPDSTPIKGEVPIKIVHTRTGEVIGYLGRLNWVLSKYPNTENYRNVVTPEDFEDGDEIPATVKTIQQHEAELMEIRNKIIKHHNSGSNPVTSVIPSIGPGFLIENTVAVTKDSYGVKAESAAKLLPDPKLQIGIVQKGSIQTGNASVFDGSLTVDEKVLKDLNGTIHAIAPMPNGQHSLIPLMNKSLEDYDVDTMLHAIESYLTSNKEAIAEFNKLTGFDLGKADGLRSFINQHYTFMQSFVLADLEQSSSPEAVSRFLFNITNESAGFPRAEISAGISYSGKGKLVATIDKTTGKLNPDFEAAFRKGMKSRFKNVVYSNSAKGLKGINSKGSITEVSYVDGKLAARGKPHASYNDYVKSFSQTKYNGTNQSADGSYIYGVHPNIEISLQGVRKSKPGRQAAEAIDAASLSPEETPTVTTIQPEEIHEDEMDLFGDSGFSAGMREDEDTSESNNSRVVTLKLLEDIHTFETPEARRNAKTPEQAFDELQKAGIRKLPEGFNPFKKCD